MKTCGGEMLGSSVVEEVDPAESFVGLATLIVEGRVPGGARGYGEGPHSPPATASASRHECDPRAFLGPPLEYSPLAVYEKIMIHLPLFCADSIEMEISNIPTFVDELFW